MTEKATSPLLTIAIPTWNRADFLALNLARLADEGRELWAMVELLVSDNASRDHTPSVIEGAKANGVPLRYIRNAENIGSDANIAQCFNLAQAKFVLILGDDDLFVDGALSLLLKHLAVADYGVVCLRPYGFEADFRHEYPGPAGRERVFSDAGEFLAAVGPLMTLISSCAINKQLLPGMDARLFCGDNLVQVHLVLRAALLGPKNLFLERYLIACKRNNSGGYDFSQVFVSNLSAVMDSCRSHGLTDKAIRAIEGRLMLAYHPFYLFRQRLSNSGDLESTYARFSARFYDRRLFRYWLAPIIQLPRPLGIAWGALTTVVGRTINGDFRRGVVFACNRLVRGVLRR